MSLPFYPVAAGAHGPDHAGRDPGHEGVGRDAPGDDRSGGDHGPLADLEPAEDRGAGPERRPRRTTVGTSSQSPSPRGRPSGATARGQGSFVNCTPGPTKTPSSSVTPR